MMYAIVEVGGRQWKVEPGARVEVNRLPTSVGAEHTIEQVLLTHDGQTARVGRPYVQGAKVVCEVVAHPLGPKVISYHFRRRENWRKTVGHRQPLTQLVVKNILLAGSPPSSTQPVERAVAPPTAKARTAKPTTSKALKAATKPSKRSA